jgi:hypothetical protein
VNSTGARANALLVVELVTARAGELPPDVLQRLGQLLLDRLDDEDLALRCRSGAVFARLPLGDVVPGLVAACGARDAASTRRGAALEALSGLVAACHQPAMALVLDSVRTSAMHVPMALCTATRETTL